MRIAMLGSRGIPASYSGVETAVEHLARGFVERGHDVTVYCRSHAVEHRREHVGAKLVHLPALQNKYLDTLSHTALSTGHLVRGNRPDVALYAISGNAPVIPIARLAGVPSVLQIDGLDSLRAKWPKPARAYLRATERLSPIAATIAVTDSETVARDYEARFGRRLLSIPYGASLEDPGDLGRCAELGVEPGKFVLFVGRLVPENNPHLLVAAHAALETDWPLVIVGDGRYADSYVDELHSSADERVRFPGAIYGPGYGELVHRAGVVCVPTEVGGTHPVIVEAMAAGAALLVSDHAPNLEVVGDSAAVFPLAGGARALSRQLAELIADEDRRANLGVRARARATSRYSWDTCVEQYLALFAAVIERGAPS